MAAVYMIASHICRNKKPLKTVWPDCKAVRYLRRSTENKQKRKIILGHCITLNSKQPRHYVNNHEPEKSR